MVTRDFDAMLADKANIRPTFKVGGQEFTIKARMSNARYFAMQAYMRSDDVTEQDALRKLFDTALIKADKERFFALLDNEGDDDDESALIDVAQLDALTTWMLDFYSGKLKTNANSSVDGTNGTGPRPNVVSLNARTS